MFKLTVADYVYHRITLMLRGFLQRLISNETKVLKVTSHQLNMANRFLKNLGNVFLLTLKITLISGLDLTLLHTNDVHGRIEEFNKYGGYCEREDSAERRCFGGVARRYSLLQDMRLMKDNLIYLNAGDYFKGTLWYVNYRGKATAHFNNKMGINVACFGNHEFDDGPGILSSFMKNITYPIVACNLDSSNEPLLNGLYQPSLVLEVGGEQIGVVGYITQETTDLVPPDSVKNLVFLDPITSIRREVHKLTTSGINKIIVLGHGGFSLDKHIASEVAGVDIVVGGHSNTFLYTGNPPANEDPAGPYPFIVQQDGGEQVLVVQDYAFGKYMGHLDVTFDEEGKVVLYRGNPILLDNTVVQDPTILQEVQEWKKPLENLKNTKVGQSYVLLQGAREECRLRECNLGNLVADAIFHYHVTNLDTRNGPWSEASLAIWNSGGIRSSIGQGMVSIGDILEVLPFRNEIIGFKLRGKYILKVLEHSVSGYRVIDPPGRFLQFSGAKVTYDVSRPIGQRVVHVAIRCADCQVPRYERLVKHRMYSVITNAFLASGGDGFKTFTAHAREHVPYGTIVADAVRAYIEKFSPVVQEVDGRITILQPTPLHTDIVCSRGSLIHSISVYLSILLAILTHTAVTWTGSI